ncbi:hypothetical protein [Clostridium sp. HCS.1]|uniref:hypothetical protein n=1 Tax=Clostridium sp. HCS.1 TaxID=3238594 RepID=UPI003A10318D
MAIEQGTKSLLVFGFIIVVVIVALCICLLWKKTKNNGLLWFIPQLVMLSLCLILFIRLINNQRTISPAMLSEENSLFIGLIAISWALSMLLMSIGIIVSFKNKKRLD